MFDDLDERPWFVFRLPEATAYVPAATEASARASLRKNAYPGAPVDAYPLVGTRYASREALSRSLLRPRAARVITDER